MDKKKKEKLFEKRNKMHHQYAVEPNSTTTVANAYLKDLEKVLKQQTRNKIRSLYTKNVTKHEDELINDILGAITNPVDIAHFFLGSHIRFEGDNGFMYEKWVKDFGPQIGVNGEVINGPRKNRVSSHNSVNQQYAISGPVVNEALFGTILLDPEKPNGAKCTWIQLENRPVGGFNEFKNAPLKFLIDVILHMINYFDYRITKRNIGPHGKSNYTESNPLKINVANVTPELAAKRASLWKDIIFERMGDITGLEDRMVLAGLDVPAGFNAIPNANV